MLRNFIPNKGMEKTKNKTEKIAWPIRNGGFLFCHGHEVIFCKADGAYTHIHLGDGTELVVAHRLKKVELLLGGLPFFRIHDSCVINLNHARRLTKEDNLFILHTDAHQLLVAKARKKALLEAFYVLKETPDHVKNGG